MKTKGGREKLERASRATKADLGLGPNRSPVVNLVGRCSFWDNAVSPPPPGGEHVKECLFLSLRPVPAAQRRCHGDLSFAQLRDRCPQGYPRCVRFDYREGKPLPESHYKEFAMHQKALATLRAWLSVHQVTHVAMESTGYIGSRFGMRSKDISNCCQPIQYLHDCRKSRGSDFSGVLQKGVKEFLDFK